MEVIIPNVEMKLFADNGECAFCLKTPSFRFAGGEIIFILGHNGSGKSTFLKVVSGELVPSHGPLLIRVNGVDIKSGPPLVSVVRQSTDENVACDLTVNENLLLRLPPETWIDSVFPLKAMSVRLSGALKNHGALTSNGNMPVRNLSLGQRQRLAFVAATAGIPRLLLLDEFLASTDVNVSAALLELTHEFVSQNDAIAFVVSHDISVALVHASRILVLDSGTVCKEMTRENDEWNEQSVLNLIRKY
ncbi:MAG: ATP-binding cassette domain-containing protein [Planctomycetes bacterium]|nr:ATP-binding cassette domain-containing protein [Planctomycetota bacterium]